MSPFRRVRERKVNRRLTEKERNWLIRGLNTLRTGEYDGGGWRDDGKGGVKPLVEPIDPQPYLEQIDDLRVESECKCGKPLCESVGFRFDAPEDTDIGVLVWYFTEDNRHDLIIWFDRTTNKIVSLEVL